MKKRRSPQEKKSLSYKKDHYVSAGESRHAFRNNWPKKKAMSNQVHRHRAVEALQTIESLGDLESIENAPIEVTAEQLRKRDPRKKLHKDGVRPLNEHIRRNQRMRQEHAENTRKKRARIDRKFVSAITALERDISSGPAQGFLRKLLPRGGWEVRNFLERNPQWRARLQQVVDEVNRLQGKSSLQQQRKQTEKERMKLLLDSIQRQVLPL